MVNCALNFCLFFVFQFDRLAPRLSTKGESSTSKTTATSASLGALYELGTAGSAIAACTDSTTIVACLETVSGPKTTDGQNNRVLKSGASLQTFACAFYRFVSVLFTGGSGGLLGCVCSVYWLIDFYDNDQVVTKISCFETSFQVYLTTLSGVCFDARL